MTSPTPPATPPYVTILIKGQLGPCWSDWFGGLTLTPAGADQHDTRLSGPVADQAALHGILNQISSLGLTLVSVACLGSREEPPGAKNTGSTNPGDTDITVPEESNTQL
jgi:hypothetical protein